MKLEEIPKVRVVAPDGKTVLEGYYFEMPKYCPYPIADGEDGEDDPPTVQCVVACVYGDWGLPNTAKIYAITPPHMIEVIDNKAKHSELAKHSLAISTTESGQRKGG